MICLCGEQIIRKRKNSNNEILCKKCNNRRRNNKYAVSLCVSCNSFKKDRLIIAGKFPGVLI